MHELSGCLLVDRKNRVGARGGFVSLFVSFMGRDRRWEVRRECTHEPRYV
jgi:hypothetical protein